MTVQFPAIRPSERELTPAVLPQAKVRTESRRTSRWVLANDGGGATVALTFANITDAWAESIRQTHSLSKGTYDSLVLPPELWVGDPELEAFLAGAGAWRFAEPPQIEWQKRGRTTVTVRLVQKRRDALPGFNPNAPPLLPWIPPTVPNPGPVPPLGPDGPDPPEPPPSLGYVYFIVDDLVEEVYSNPSFGTNADNQPGPSLVVGADFATCSAYTPADEAALRNFCIGRWDYEGYEMWSQMFGLSSAGGEVKEPSMLALASSSRIVAGLPETGPDRLTLVGVDVDGANPAAVASYSGFTISLDSRRKNFARDYPSGYVLCGTASDQSRLVVTKINEDFSIANTVTLAHGSSVTLTDYSCVPDPGGSGRIFVITHIYGITCLDSSLSMVWSRAFSDMFVFGATVNPAGNLVVTGRRVGSSGGVPVAIIRGTDGVLLLSSQVTVPGGSNGSEGKYISVRPEGGYIISSDDNSLAGNYGFVNHVAVNDIFDNVDYAIRISSYPPSQVIFTSMGPSGSGIVFSGGYMLVTHRPTYGILPAPTSSSASYLITSTQNVATSAPGTFGPDPKLVVAVTATISSGSTTLSGTPTSLEVGGPTVAASSRIVPVSLPVRRTGYPKTPL